MLLLVLVAFLLSIVALLFCAKLFGLGQMRGWLSLARDVFGALLLIVVLGAMIGLAVTSETDHLLIGAISVPDSLRAAGYNGKTVADIVYRHVIEIVYRGAARSSETAPLYRSVDESSDRISVAVSGISLSAVLSELRRHLGRGPMTAQGSVVSMGDSIFLYIQLDHPSLWTADCSKVLRGTIADMDSLLFASALEIVLEYSPLNYVQYQELRGRLFTIPKQLVARAYEKTGTDRAEALYVWGHSLVGMGEYSAALIKYREGIAAEPTFWACYSGLAGLYDLQGKRDSANLIYQVGLSANPTSLDLRIDRAAALRREGRLDEAVLENHAILAIDPRCAAAMCWLADIAAERQRPGEAKEWYIRAIQAQPLYATAHNNLGTLLVDLGDTAGGRSEYLTAQAIDSAMIEPYLNLGNVEFAQRDFRRAINLWNHATRMVPRIEELGYGDQVFTSDTAARAHAFAQAFWFIGLAYDSLGESLSARTAYGRSILSDSTSEYARLARGALSSCSGSQ